MGTFKMILGIFVVVAALVAGIQVIPAYYTNYEFQDAIKTEALISTNSAKSEADIKTTVLKKAKELGLPITEDNLKVQRTGIQGTGTVNIDASYTVHLDLPLYPIDLHFEPSAANRGAF